MHQHKAKKDIAIHHPDQTPESQKDDIASPAPAVGYQSQTSTAQENQAPSTNGHDYPKPAFQFHSRKKSREEEFPEHTEASAQFSAMSRVQQLAHALASVSQGRFKSTPTKEGHPPMPAFQLHSRKKIREEEFPEDTPAPVQAKSNANGVNHPTNDVQAHHETDQPAQLQAQSQPTANKTQEVNYPYKGIINTQGTGFHKEPRPATDIQKDYIRPDFKLGAEVTVIGKTPQNWLRVKRVMEGKEVMGYVDWRYLDQAPQKKEEPLGPIELDEVVIERLSHASIRERAKVIQDLMERTAVSWNPANIDWVISDQDVDTALKQLQAYFEALHNDDFGRMVIVLKESGHLATLFGELNEQHVQDHAGILFKLSVFLPQSQLIDLTQKFVVEESAEEGVQEISRRIFRIPTWDDWSPLDRDTFRKPTEENPNPIDTEGIKSDMRNKLVAEMEEFLDNQEQVMASIDENVTAAMELKAYEIRHYLETENYPELRRQLIEVDQMADAALELLFADQPSNPLLTKTFFAPILPLWEKLKSEPAIPSVYLGNYGPENKLSDRYNSETGQLIDPNAPKQNPTPSLATTQSGKGNQNEEPGLSARTKTLIKELIVKEAEHIHQFFYTDLVELTEAHPEMVPMINHLLRFDLRPAAQDRLSEGVDIGPQTTSDNLSPKSLNAMTWMDLARVWYYELGAVSLGRNKKEAIKFGNDAKTTQEIMNHPSGKEVIGYACARAQSGDHSEFKAFIHYDVNGFFKAIASRDSMFNFMGSFTVTVTPAPEKGIIKFEAYNVSSKESATRFRRKEDAKPGEINKIGMFENTERGTEGVPHFGGNLRALWTWTVPIQP